MLMGGQKNKYLESVIPFFYRREAMHIMIFSFIDGYQKAFPSITIQEAASAFMIHYKVDEDLYQQNTVVSIYLRLKSEYSDAQRLENKQRQP